MFGFELDFWDYAKFAAIARKHPDAEPFASFTFSPMGAAAYRVGDHGTAMTKLHEVVLKP